MRRRALHKESQIRETTRAEGNGCGMDLQTTFAARYRDKIRVGFNWFRFFNEKWPVDLVTMSNRSELSRCFLPWYIGPLGKELPYDDPRAVPLRLDDVPKSMELLNESRKADILHKAREFHGTGKQVHLAAATYALPPNEHFVLDGNHRLSAVLLGSMPFEITLWNVRGPLDSDCLLDLIHWLPQCKPS